MSSTATPFSETIEFRENEQELSCCKLDQAPGEFVLQTSIEKDHRLASLQELVETLTLQHLNAHTSLENIGTLFQAVVSTHKKTYPELERAANIFLLLADELRPHMLKEERVLFPFVIRLEKTDEFGLQSLLSPFSGLQNPLRVMTVEHEATSDLFKDLRATMANYDAPANACVGHALLCETLKCFEQFLSEHFALEQDALYPRAIEMETRINLRG